MFHVYQALNQTLATQKKKNKVTIIYDHQPKQKQVVIVKVIIMKSKVTDLLTHGENNIRVAANGVTHSKIDAFPYTNSKKTQQILH